MDRAGFYISTRAFAWLGNFPIGVGPVHASVVSRKMPPEWAVGAVYEKAFPSGFRVKAARDGFIGLDFAGLEGFESKEALDTRITNENLDFSRTHMDARIPVGDAINAFLACLNGALQHSSDIRELGHVPINRLKSVGADLQPDGFQASEIKDRLATREALTGPWSSKSSFIADADLRQASEAVNSLLSDIDKGAVKVVALYNWAVGSLAEIDYARSLITSWAIIERMIEIIWKQFIKKNSVISASRVIEPPTSGKRAEKLTANTMTASIRVEILSVAGSLSGWEYENIERSRRARNAWIHTLKSVSFDDAIHAAAIAAYLIKRLYQVTVQTKYQVWGQ